MELFHSSPVIESLLQLSHSVTFCCSLVMGLASISHAPWLLPLPDTALDQQPDSMSVICSSRKPCSSSTLPSRMRDLGTTLIRKEHYSHFSP